MYFKLRIISEKAHELLHAHDHLGLGPASDENDGPGGDEPIDGNDAAENDDAEPIEQIEQVLQPAGGDGAGGFMGIGTWSRKTKTSKPKIIDLLRSQSNPHCHSFLS